MNKVRKERLQLGPLKRVPKGLRGDACSCPIHNCFAEPGSVAAEVSDTLYLEGHGEIKHPKHIKLFINDFDNGKYPNLIKRG